MSPPTSHELHQPLAPLSTALHTGCPKGKKLLLLLLPFCPQHGWLKAGKQVKFIVSHAEMTVAIWCFRGRATWQGPVAERSQPCGCSWLQNGPPAAWPPTAMQGRSPVAPSPPLGGEEESEIARFFLLKNVIIEVLLTSLIGPAKCQLSESLRIGSAGHSRSSRSFSLGSSLHGLLCPH